MKTLKPTAVEIYSTGSMLEIKVRISVQKTLISAIALYVQYVLIHPVQ